MIVANDAMMENLKRYYCMYKNIDKFITDIVIFTFVATFMLIFCFYCIHKISEVFKLLITSVNYQSMLVLYFNLLEVRLAI